ncbi:MULTISPECIES: polysaccharide deacetylase family protein [unclassified Rhizobium]|uniref:polysaccharide deacetylase family protein n=1 Tax=unclassified Rhizobium TaxID=2613769 RepID=UPI0010445D81|nr:MULTISPECIES: polysaccharide deacetylase family protein [unclassified Rhizobium]MBB3396778.1 peptidoglycan/xylan/chitin deacetylase (PgdA/CDA1 family) [Rhizobium sp. BK060]MBB4168081.1 peptidoglycan/xylan/chitin deacetylase (PgdA/CDA1 family) [Rhizobium sp. BK538]TCM80859.1 peptidoglycan/xylan/chitin deacetylase (PgdA/CDA1 family) [Rhizobium sp. BK068]
MTASVKKLAKRIAIASGLETANLLRAAGVMRGARGLGAIFTLHHVRPHEESTFEPNAHLEITPEFLDLVLDRLKSDGYRFVALAEIPALLSQTASSQPFAAFTLDDGYRNNLVYALPIFEKHEAPFTVFVAKGLAERTHTIWWETLAALLRREEKLGFDFGSGHEMLDVTTTDAKERVFARIANHLHRHDESAAVAAIDLMARKHEIDPDAIVDDLVMTPAELNLLEASPLASLGAHTISHRAMSRLSDPEVRDEMEASRDYVAAITGDRPSSFAYPYGTREAATQRQAAIAREVGFDIAVTTQPGVVTQRSLGSLTYLPRLSINGIYQNVRYVSGLASGIPFRFAPNRA